MRLFIGTPAARLRPNLLGAALLEGRLRPRQRPQIWRSGSTGSSLPSFLPGRIDGRARPRRVQPTDTPEVPPRGAQAAEGWLRRTGTAPRQCAVALARGGTT